MLNENKVKAKEVQSSCFSISENTPSCVLTLASLAALESNDIPPTPAENKLRNLDIAKLLALLALHSYPFPCLFH